MKPYFQLPSLEIELKTGNLVLFISSANNVPLSVANIKRNDMKIETKF